MATQRVVSDSQENIKAKDLKRLPWDYSPLINRKRLIKWEANLKAFVLRQLPTFNLATIECIIERKTTEVKEHSWMACYDKCK